MRSKKWVVCLTIVGLLSGAAGAIAGTGGAEFLGLYTLVSGWPDGTLGRIMAVIALIAGLATLAVLGRFIGVWNALGVAAVGSVGVGVVNALVTGVVVVVP